MMEERTIRHYKFEDIIGNNPDFLDTIAVAKKASQSEASVLVYGETGTGKELVAQSIHFSGNRKEKPFVAQNCSAIPPNLFEGILFGTEIGGFTGAVDRKGLFEQADGGTLLLDEVSSMPYELQGKLLRVLQEEYIRRIGGTEDIPVDVRIIATVNERPRQLIQSGRLRKDLYYRLSIIGIELPPLRDRKDDIHLLAEQFLQKYNQRYGKAVRCLSEEARKKLFLYDYPGNIRELENIIMAAVSMSEDEQQLTEEHLLIKL